MGRCLLKLIFCLNDMQLFLAEDGYNFQQNSDKTLENLQKAVEKGGLLL